MYRGCFFEFLPWQEKARNLAFNLKWLAPTPIPGKIHLVQKYKTKPPIGSIYKLLTVFARIGVGVNFYFCVKELDSI